MSSSHPQGISHVVVAGTPSIQLQPNFIVGVDGHRSTNATPVTHNVISNNFIRSRQREDKCGYIWRKSPHRNCL